MILLCSSLSITRALRAKYLLAGVRRARPATLITRKSKLHAATRARGLRRRLHRVLERGAPAALLLIQRLHPLLSLLLRGWTSRFHTPSSRP